MVDGRIKSWKGRCERGKKMGEQTKRMARGKKGDKKERKVRGRK